MKKCAVPPLCFVDAFSGLTDLSVKMNGCEMTLLSHKKDPTAGLSVCLPFLKQYANGGLCVLVCVLLDGVLDIIYSNLSM